MKPRTMPDFFQREDAEALRFQAEWLNDHLGLGDSFLSRLLCETESVIEAWKSANFCLQPSAEQTFRDFWAVILHLLSHYNFDETLVRSLLDDSIGPLAAAPLRPPWAGSSLRAFLEEHPSKAIDEVNRWIMSFRFGDPYVCSSICR